jgi:hypothetical protein
MATTSAIRSCGRCADGWVYEIHPDAPLAHHVDQACGVAMACTNPTCLLSWANERHPDTGLIRQAATPDAQPGPWGFPSLVRRYSWW